MTEPETPRSPKAIKRARQRANRAARRAAIARPEKRRRAKDRRIRLVTRPPFDDKPICTIIADASFLSHAKSGSWGSWIKADGRPALIKGGTFLGDLTSSVEAEMRALANALALARAAGFLPDGSCVMVQSDCQAALSWALGAVPTSCHRPLAGGVTVHPHMRPKAAMDKSPGLRSFVEIAAKGRLKIVLRHVPGHKPGSGRAYVNRLVDELAKQHRRKPQEKSHEA